MIQVAIFHRRIGTVIDHIGNQKYGAQHNRSQISRPVGTDPLFLIKYKLASNKIAVVEFSMA